MMIKKRKGFSLAEVLVTLMIVGVVAAATIPTVTKRSTGHDKLWDWADYPLGSAYYTGSHVLLDSASNAKSLPKMSVESDNFSDNYFPEAKDELDASAKPLSENVFMPSLDKMAVFNNYDESSSDESSSVNNIQRSHISFYNEITGLNSPTEVYEYGGRLGSDKTNLALGIGGLQYLIPNEENNEGMYNTVVGHYNMFVAKRASNNTVLGRFALVEFDAVEDAPATYNVAVGSKSQVYNMYGINNTAVGFRSLNGVEGVRSLGYGNFNIAIGTEAVGASGSYGNINYSPNDEKRGENSSKSKYYESGNIGIGYQAGHDMANDTNVNAQGRAYRLFIGSKSLYSGDNDVQPLESKIWHSGTNKVDGATDVILDSEFNINADELIVNTADGKHTILKIDMTGKIRDLPEFKPTSEETSGSACSGNNTRDCYTFYENLGYCAGEGSDDLYRLSKNSSDSRALADVCIAKFDGLVKVQPGEAYTNDDGHGRSILEWFNSFFSEERHKSRKPQAKTYTDWDIYLRSLDVGYSGGEMTGSHDPLHIQTVKASLNYLDAWKEGQGVLSSAIDAFVQNFKCYFQFFGTNCQSLETSDNFTLKDLIEETIQAAIKAGLDVLDKIKNTVCSSSFLGWLCSDKNLKDISGDSTAGLKEINALKIKNYTYKADKNKTPHVGVIAQELQKVFPNSVFEGPDGYLRIKQEEMFFAMVNAIKELDKQDKELKAKIPKVNKQIKTVVQKNKTLVKKNEQLKAENEKLNAQLKLLEAK